MKLVSLYIENFGGLHQYALDFDAGLTMLVQPNGFGKTTLAEFIRAMFYGFPRRSKTLDKSLRQKYTPWNGGSFGGNVTFEYEGQRYRLERSFGANPKGDTFSVIDLETGRKTKRFPEEIGQELFGLDGDSFERSTYLPQVRESEGFLTASVQAKLSDLVEESGDVANFDKAMAALKAERSALIPYRGSGGAVAETAAEMTRLQLLLDTRYAQEAQLKRAQETVAREQQMLGRTKGKLTETEQRLREAARREKDALCRRQYEQLCTRYSGAEGILNGIRKKYPGGLPGEEALRRGELAAERLKRSRETTAKALCPSAQQLEECRNLCTEYEMLHFRLRAMELPEMPQEHRQRGKGLCAAAVIFGAIAMAAGLWPVMPYGWVMFAVGAAMLAAGLITVCVQAAKRRRIRKTAAEKRLQRQKEAEALGKQVEICGKKITAFFAAAGLTVQPEQYGAALAELEQRVSRRGTQDAEEQENLRQLQVFFEGLGMELPQDLHGALQQLREDLRIAGNAQMLREALSEQIAVMEENYGQMLFAEKTDADDLQGLQREEGILREEVNAAAARMLRAEQEARQLQETIADIPVLRQQLEEMQQRLAEQRENVKLLDETMDFLRQARENLSTAYMGTIRSRFGHYLSMLGSPEENYLVDSGLQVQLERQGQSRELAYFSAGQTDLVMLCMRLALVDALFKNEDMFVVLDDPFVNLDDAHMGQARKFLRDLAAKRQILYLTCHSGRAI